MFAASREPPAEAGRHAAAAGTMREATVIERDGHFFESAPRRRRPLARLPRAARRGAAAAVHRRAPPTPPTRRATRRCMRAQPGAVAAPTAGLHFDDALLDALRGAGVAIGVRHAARRRRHVPAGRDRGPLAAWDARRVVSHSAGDRGRDRRRRARAGDASSRSARPACARWSRPRTIRAACARAKRETRALHHARLPLSRRRSPADQFPSAELDAADAGVGVRRLRRDSRRVCARDRAAATASSVTATRCCSSARRMRVERARIQRTPSARRTAGV